VRDLFDLSGKRAIITGGAGLLGIQHARALLLKNCEVDLWDIDSKGLEIAKSTLEAEFLDSSVTSTTIDITSENAVGSVVQSYRDSSKSINILINNAALNPKFPESSSSSNSQFESYSIEIWNREISVGLTGAMLCSKHVGTYMASLGSGVIVNIASDLSVIAPDQRIYKLHGEKAHSQFKKPVSYSVIKTGLIGLTKFLSTYWVENGIRANALSPGGVNDNQDPVFVQNLITRIPMARMAEANEYIGAIQFLCSDASSYMNGQNLVIDGGRSIW
jgi:NAD(P)-dependent dehydrogenase (short-subunit alcohol dehydrogenase family)